MHRWTNMQKIEVEAIVVFENLLASAMVFQKIKFMLFATFEIVLGRHICFTRSSDFVIQKLFLKFHSELYRVI